jgi:hypothetical protein
MNVPVLKDSYKYVKPLLAWFKYFPPVSKLLLFFGCVLLLSGVFGLIPSRTIFSFRLMCLGLSWDYFFRFRIAGINKEEYHDGSVQRTPWIDPRIIGGIFFLGLAVVPSAYLFWIFHRLSS